MESTASEYSKYRVESHSFLRIQDLPQLPYDICKSFDFLLHQLAKDPLQPLTPRSNLCQLERNYYFQKIRWRRTREQYCIVYKVIHRPDSKIQVISFAKYNLALDRAEERLLEDPLRIAAQQFQFFFNLHQNNGNSNHHNGSTVNNESSNGNTYNQSGNIGIGHMSGGDIKDEAKVAGVINEAPQQNLAEAAAQIQQLLEQLDKSYPTDTTAGKMAIATEAVKQIEANPTLMARILSALKAGGISAFEQFLNHPAASFVIGALQDFQETGKNQ